MDSESLSAVAYRIIQSVSRLGSINRSADSLLFLFLIFFVESAIFLVSSSRRLRGMTTALSELESIGQSIIDSSGGFVMPLVFVTFVINRRKCCDDVDARCRKGDYLLAYGKIQA